MKAVVSIDDVLQHWDDWKIIDVRSPGEFATGHIPGAINLPLFDNAERSIVGTLYKQKSPEAAFREGLRIAGSKMVELVDAAKRIQRKTDKKMLVHCWRGGKRSGAIEWLFSFSGIETYRLDGGYKSYRSRLLSFFEKNPFTFKILGGHTGAGKTEILELLSKSGQQVINLEKLANHKGSAFGSIGEEPQPSNEQFSNNLFLAFLNLDPGRPVWLENESKSIGKCHLPEAFWWQMRSSTLYTIEVDKEVRLRRVLKDYGEPVDYELLKISFEKIRKRLGGLGFQHAINALDNKDLSGAAEIALDYYDKTYTYQLSQWPEDSRIYLAGGFQLEEIVQKLITSY